MNIDWDQPVDCDAGGAATIYIDNKTGKVTCLCMVCARCGHHTGNSNQGHYWLFCSYSKKLEVKHHFCCPNDCAIYGEY